MHLKVLILGVTGMLGHKLFNLMSMHDGFDVYGVARSIDGLTGFFQPEMLKKIKTNIDGENIDSVLRTVVNIKPDVVINCIGVIKQAPAVRDHQTILSINSLLPHRLALVCRVAGARLIHISTDCVFDGHKGNYTEKDLPNATDLYGRSKSLGEIAYPNCITLRTSIIGHELKGKYGLIEWFLAQQGRVKGYTKAIYSGFPTTELERIIREYVITNSKLEGLFHVSSNSISKYGLLKMVAAIYGKQIEIEPDESFICDRSLDSSLFRKTAGYIPPEWPVLIEEMYKDYFKYSYGKKIGG